MTKYQPSRGKYQPFFVLVILFGKKLVQIGFIATLDLVAYHI